MDTACTTTVTATLTPGPNYVGDYLPQAVIPNNFIYVNVLNDANWYGISSVSQMTSTCMNSTQSMKVLQAAAIDDKMDDGLPTSGAVLAKFLTCGGAFSSATATTNPSAITCYDTTSNKYSTGQNGGEGLNCALALKVQ